MVNFIVGGIFLLGAFSFLLLAITTKHIAKTYIPMSITCLLVGGLFVGAGSYLKIEAERNYSEMLDSKTFIEQNYNSDDMFTQWEAHDEYFKYMFRYERMLESHACGVFSMYYGYDMSELELNIAKEGE